MNKIQEADVYIGSERCGDKEFITITRKGTGEIVDQYWKQIKHGKYQPPPEGKNPNFYKVYATNWQDVIHKKKLTFSEVGLL